MKHYLLRRGRTFRLSHRWLGFVVVVPLLFVTATGLLLNHSSELGLNDHHAGASWIRSQYGSDLKGEPVTFDALGHSVSGWDGQLFFNGELLDVNGELQGAVGLRELVIVACRKSVYVLDGAGELMEELDELSLPEGDIVRCGTGSGQRLTVELDDETRWVFSEDLLSFAQLERGIFMVAGSVETSSSLQEEMQLAYGGDGPTWNRVIMDMHSGRFFGSIGRLLVDLMGLLVVFLSITGLVLGVRSVRRGRKEAAQDRDDEN